MSQIPIDEGASADDEAGADSTARESRAPDSSPTAEGADSDERPVEEDLARLEAIVQRLESEAVSLDESIALFEEGVAIAVRVRRRLDASEGRIKRIVERSEGLFSLEDFDLA